MGKLLGIKELCEFWQAIKSDMGDYVLKAGDTMTGNLTIKKASPQITANSTSMDLKQANNGGQYAAALVTSDKNGYAVGSVQMQTYTSGMTESLISVSNRNTSGAVVGTNTLSVRVAKDGTLSYYVSSPAAFRTAIGAVNIAGDTMTGVLTISKSTPYVFLKNTDVDASKANNNVSTTKWWGTASRDTSGRTVAQFLGEARSDGTTGAGMWVYNFDTSGTSVGTAALQILMDKSGNVSYSVANPSNFRYAISAATKTWTQIAQVQGTNSATYTNYGGYSGEAMLMIWYGTVYLGTAVWPCSSIGATQYEIYTGGGRSGTGTGQRRACAKVSNGKLTGVLCAVDGTDVTSSSYFRLYAR